MAEAFLNKESIALAVSYSDTFKKALSSWKKKDNSFFMRIADQIDKIIQNPLFGKPLRYSYKNNRRVHIGSFVLIYEFHSNELRFIDFDHHDKIYNKYK